MGFLAGFLKFGLDHKEFLVILILLGALGLGFLYIKTLHAENASLISQKTALETQNKTLKDNITSLEGNLAISNKSITDLQKAISDQNTAINVLKNMEVERALANAKDIAAAAAKADSYRQDAINILKQKPQLADKCTAANSLYNQEIRKNAKK